MLDTRLTTYLSVRLVNRLLKYKTRRNHVMVAKINSQIASLNTWFNDYGCTYDSYLGWSK